MILINKSTHSISKFYLILILLILLSFHLLFIFILFNHHIQSFSYHYYLKFVVLNDTILIKSSSFSYSISIDSISLHLFNQYQFTISNTLLQTNNQFISTSSFILFQIISISFICYHIHFYHQYSYQSSINYLHSLNREILKHNL